MKFFNEKEFALFFQKSRIFKRANYSIINLTWLLPEKSHGLGILTYLLGTYFAENGTNTPPKIRPDLAAIPCPTGAIDL